MFATFETAREFALSTPAWDQEFFQNCSQNMIQLCKFYIYFLIVYVVTKIEPTNMSVRVFAQIKYMNGYGHLYSWFDQWPVRTWQQLL